MAHREPGTNRPDVGETVMIHGQLLRLDKPTETLDPTAVREKFDPEGPYRIRGEDNRERLYLGIFGTPLPRYG